MSPSGKQIAWMSSSPLMRRQWTPVALHFIAQEPSCEHLLDEALTISTELHSTMSLYSEANLRCSVSDILDNRQRFPLAGTCTQLTFLMPCPRTYPIRMALEFLMSPKSTRRHIRTWNRSRPRYPSHLQQTKTESAKENWCVKSTGQEAIVIYGENTALLFSKTTSKD